MLLHEDMQVVLDTVAALVAAVVLSIRRSGVELEIAIRAEPTHTRRTSLLIQVDCTNDASYASGGRSPTLLRSAEAISEISMAQGPTAEWPSPCAQGLGKVTHGCSV